MVGFADGFESNMSKIVTVVVSGVGSTIGLGIAKALRISADRWKQTGQGIGDIRIVGIDSNPLAVGLYCLDSVHLVPSGVASFEDYYQGIIAVCQKERADIFLSGWDGELIALGERADDFYAQCGTKIGHRQTGIAEASDKWLTYVLLAQKSGIAMPMTVQPLDETAVGEFMNAHTAPYIMKPRRGSGGRGLFVVKTLEEIRFLSSYLEDPILQEELLPAEEEYTIGVFMMDGGEASGALVLKRSLMSGLSYRMEVVDEPVLVEFAISAVRAIGLVGAANVQLRWTSDGPKLLEINPRFSSSSSVRAYYGFNEPELAIRYFLHGERPQVKSTQTGICLRYWEEMFVPADARIKGAQGEFTTGYNYGLIADGWQKNVDT
jgi:carbamoyl-phosphate synthase large subunit